MVYAQKIMRILRESRDYSQEYVANVLNINQKTYSNLETGKSKLTLDRMKKLSEFYNVDLEYFLSEELPVINYNSGKYSRSVVAKNSYKESNDSSQEKLLERIITEKDKQIAHLISELEGLKEEKAKILDLL